MLCQHLDLEKISLAVIFFEALRIESPRRILSALRAPRVLKRLLHLRRWHPVDHIDPDAQFSQFQGGDFRNLMDGGLDAL